MSSWWKKAHQLGKKHQRPSFKRNGEQTLLWWKVCSLVVCIKKCYCAAANLRVSDVGASLKVAKSPVCLSGVSELFRKNGRRLVLDGRQWCKAYCTICKRQLISLNLSLWCKCQLHSVMAVEKWHHPCLAFTMVLSLPPGWIFFLLNSSLNYGTREHFCRCATQTGRDVVFPGHYPPGSSGTPGTTVGTLHCKEKDPLMEEEKTLKRESDRNWSNIKTETLVRHVSASYDVNLCTNIFWLVALALGGALIL